MKKLLLFVIMVIPLMVSACSCNKFNIGTYESAVKKFDDSIGFEYNLKITTEYANENYYHVETSHNTYMLTTTGEVENFSSKSRKEKTITHELGPNDAPIIEYTAETYYVGSSRKLYKKESLSTGREESSVESISYESKYSNPSDRYNIDNLIPTFAEDEMLDFSISKVEGSEGCSIAVFTASIPSYISSDEDTTVYSVTMDKDFYFSSITFSVIVGDKTITYEYQFINFNSDVVVTFPTNLEDY